jgi:putative ABC transport system ATP-binding protein
VPVSSENPASNEATQDVEVLRVEGLRKVFGSGAQAIEALKGIDLVAHSGELIALLGPSGSGKSTLLLSIALIELPSAGRVVVEGREIFKDGIVRADVRRLRRERIGFIFQQHNLIPFANARDNIALALTLNGTPGRAARKRADELLEYLEIGHRAKALPAEMSGGEQQRIAIGRALANSPPIIFADEPTASLDTTRGHRVMDLLQRIAKERRSAVITVTHDQRMIEGFDSVYHLIDGRLENHVRTG